MQHIFKVSIFFIIFVSFANLLASENNSLRNNHGFVRALVDDGLFSQESQQIQDLKDTLDLYKRRVKYLQRELNSVTAINARLLEANAGYRRIIGNLQLELAKVHTMIFKARQAELSNALSI